MTKSQSNANIFFMMGYPPKYFFRISEKNIKTFPPLL
jgi:hypothetical protein